MKRILICIGTKLTPKMRNSAIKVVRKCDYNNIVNSCRLLGLAYNSIPIKHGNMNRIAVLMNEVREVC